MALILVFKEEPQRMFQLQLTVAFQPPESASIVYELPVGPVEVQSRRDAAVVHGVGGWPEAVGVRDG